MACMAPSVKVWLPTVIGSSPEEGMIKAMNMLLNFLPKLERWLRLPPTALYSHGRLNIKVSSRHIVLLQSVLGAAIEEVGECNHLVIKAPDGKEGFIYDKSKGEAELENVNIGYGVDPSENLNDLEKQLGPEGIKKALHEYAYGLAPLPSEQKASMDMIGAQIEDINKNMLEWQTTVLPTLDYFSEQIQAHTKTAEANLFAGQALIEAIAEIRRIIDAIVWPFKIILKVLGKNNDKKGAD